MKNIPDLYYKNFKRNYFIIILFKNVTMLVLAFSESWSKIIIKSLNFHKIFFKYFLKEKIKLNKKKSWKIVQIDWEKVFLSKLPIFKILTDKVNGPIRYLSNLVIYSAGTILGFWWIHVKSRDFTWIYFTFYVKFTWIHVISRDFT